MVYIKIFHALPFPLLTSFCLFLYDFVMNSSFFFLLICFYCFFFFFDFITFGTKDVESVQRELKEDEALPKLLVAGIAIVGLGLLISNALLVAWFIIRKRIKGKKNTTRKRFFLLFAFLLVERFFSVLFYLIFFFFGNSCWFPLLGILSIFFSLWLEQFSLWLIFRHWF